MMKAFLTQDFQISSAHFLPDYSGVCSELHGHNWKIKITIGGNVDPKTHMLVDFKIVKAYTNEVLKKYDHKLLNNIPNLYPTAEELACLLFDEMIGLISIFGNSTLFLESVEVIESEGSSITVRRT